MKKRVEGVPIRVVVLVVLVLSCAHRDVVAQEDNSARHLFFINARTIPGGLKDPAGLCWDSINEELFVADTGNHVVDILDKNGNMLYQFGSLSFLSSPVDVVVRNRRIYISDMDRSRIMVINYRGEPLAELTPPKEEAEGFLPGRIARGPDGTLLAVDRSTQSILVFDPQDRFRTRLVSEGRYRFITGLFCSGRGEIFVVDASGTAVHILDGSGKKLLGFGTHGTKASNFSLPGEVRVDESDRIWVVDTFGHSVKVFNRSGRFLARLGGMGAGPGQFLYPVDIAFVAPDRLYILEKAGARIQVFDISKLKIR